MPEASNEPHEAIDWTEVAEDVAIECPSPSMRKEAVRILQRIEALGPLRLSPRDEFQKVYRSLNWNPPDRVLSVVDALLARRRSSTAKPTEIRIDAWGYVVGVLDEWVTQARVFYLVSGILENTLRSRLNARLSDVYGSSWPDITGSAPSKLHEYARNARRDEQLANIHDLVDAAPDPSLLLDRLKEILSLQMSSRPRIGAEFLQDMTFAGLRMFFEKGQNWTGKLDLVSLFRGKDGRQVPPNRDRALSVLAKLNDARNDVAHYRPAKYATFDEPLFAAATLAQWFGEDLQHVYESIDVRETTELSVLLRNLALPVGLDAIPLCANAGCTVGPPYTWLFSRAPRAQEDIQAIGANYACLLHRVTHRRLTHHARKETGGSH